MKISIGQALLLLIDKYKDKDPEKLKKLKKLYLVGLNCAQDNAELASFLADDALLGHTVERTIASIDSDPTRRYFESQLAFNIVSRPLKHITEASLHDYEQLITNQLPKEWQGVCRTGTDPLGLGMSPELPVKYAAIASNPHLEEKKTLAKTLIKISYIAIKLTHIYSQYLPFNIYGQHKFYKGKNRGIAKKESQQEVRAKHLGLMRSYMPVGLDDVLFSDIQSLEMRPADKSRFVPNTKWVNYSFSKQVHPFSNGLSGTMLAQLRVLARYGAGFIKDKETFIEFIQLFSASLLYVNGGHSFFEFMMPVFLDEVKPFFAHIPGVCELDMHDMLTECCSTQVDNALDSAVSYNNHIIEKNRMLIQIKEAHQKRIIKIIQDIIFDPRWNEQGYTLSFFPKIPEGIRLMRESKSHFLNEYVEIAKTRMSKSVGLQRGIRKQGGMSADFYKTILSLDLDQMDESEKKLNSFKARMHHNDNLCKRLEEQSTSQGVVFPEDIRFKF